MKLRLACLLVLAALAGNASAADARNRAHQAPNNESRIESP